MLMKISDAADALNVAPQTIRRWAHAKTIRSVLLPSGHLRVYRADIVAILNSGKQTGVSPHRP